MKALSLAFASVALIVSLSAEAHALVTCIAAAPYSGYEVRMESPAQSGLPQAIDVVVTRPSTGAQRVAYLVRTPGSYTYASPEGAEEAISLTFLEEGYGEMFLSPYLTFSVTNANLGKRAFGRCFPL